MLEEPCHLYSIRYQARFIKDITQKGLPRVGEVIRTVQLRFASRIETLLNITALEGDGSGGQIAAMVASRRDRKQAIGGALTASIVCRPFVCRDEVYATLSETIPGVSATTEFTDLRSADRMSGRLCPVVVCFLQGPAAFTVRREQNLISVGDEISKFFPSLRFSRFDLVS